MDELGYTSLEQVAQQIGINRGNLHRYFTLENRPSIALLPAMSKTLQASYEEILQALKCK
jgi:transcriptional regulator with XRE-family HTH domain